MKRDILEKQEKMRIPQITNLDDIKNAKKDYALPIEVRIKKIGDQDGFKIFLVDGYKIRQFIDMDFTMGGHGFRYVYVPFDEVWIDNSNKSETAEVTVHEIHEAKLMKDGIDYGDAHESASLVELELRNKKIILPVGGFIQPNESSCGPSSLKIVLDYFKDKRSVDYLIKETKCDENGTLHSGFIEAMEKLGYKYFEQADSSVEQIENFIQKGIPVIVDYQDHHFHSGGHFSVVIGYDNEKFIFSNPSLEEKHEWINKKDFEKDWWEEDEPGKIVKKWMLAVYPKGF